MTRMLVRVAIVTAIFSSAVTLYAIDSALDGWRIEVGQSKTVTLFNGGKHNILNSGCPAAIFVPTRNAAEWDAFAAYHPNCVFISKFAACQDGIDNDRDGSIDYSASCSESEIKKKGYCSGDPGCSSPTDNDEKAPAWTFPQCDDGIDNDGDGRVDYRPGGLWSAGDLECSSPSDDNERASNPTSDPLFCGKNPAAEACQQQAQSYTPSVDLYFNDNTNTNSVTVPGNAYQTYARINWNVQDSCGCASSPGSLWTGVLLDSSNDSVSSKTETINTPGAVTYTLTCNRQPSCSASADTKSDSVTVTPDWRPSFSFSSPTLQVTSNDDVFLEWSGNDLKSCTAGGWGGPSPSALQTANSGALGQNQRHSVNLGKITSDKTYSLSCTGFNNVVLAQQTVNVTLLKNPTPYFFINSINLIIVGPGSGGRSNKATIGVTPGGGFTGTINLSAARPQALVNAGATLHIEPSTVMCDGTSCTTAEFWVETPGDIPEGVYTITLTADPEPLGFDSKTADIPLRVRRFVPAFEEI